MLGYRQINKLIVARLRTYIRNIYSQIIIQVNYLNKKYFFLY